jgi:ketosteroid isomerase-like protein
VVGLRHGRPTVSGHARDIGGANAGVARARATGRRLEFPIVQTLRVVDGRIAEVRPFYWDVAAIAAACR